MGGGPALSAVERGTRPPSTRNLVDGSRITLLKPMRIKAKILAIALLLSVATTLLGESMLQSLIRSQQLEGCHEHGHRPARSSSPSPVSHLCCNAGHEAAILPDRLDLGYSLIHVSLPSDCPELLIRKTSFRSFSSTIVLPSSSPGKLQLRI